MASRRTRMAWLVPGLVLLAASVLWAVWSGVELLGRRTERFTQQFAPEELSAPVTALDIDTHGTIRVTGNDGDTVVVERRVVRSLRSPEVSMRIDGSSLVLRGRCPAVSSFCSVDWTVSVPRGVTVRARASAGGVRVTSIDGPVDADSSGGSIRAEATTGRLTLVSSGGGVELVGTVGAVRASSSGGGVRGDDVRSADVDATSSGGGVTLRFAAAPTSVRASSSGGGVTIELPRDESSYRTDVSSSGGDTSVDVRSDPAATRSITADSSGGSVRVRYRTDG